MKLKQILPLALLVTTPLFAQSAKELGQVERNSAGTSPADPGPLATDLSPAFTHADVHKAMKKVSDWQIKAAEPVFNQQWTFAALYDGMLAYSKQTKDPSAQDAVRRMAEKFDWKLIEVRFPHADDEAVGKSYLELFTQDHVPAHAAPTVAIMDRLVARPDEAKPVWWWCDALFMAPPLLVHLSAVTGDHKYIDYMNKEWKITAALLYDKQEHLYFRDDRFLDVAKQHEANGKKVFWSRGDGWVVAGLAEILENLPKNDPARPMYEQQFKDMVNKIASLQPADGLWRTGLLDPEAYKMPEVSGTAFFTFAMAYGVNHGLLDRAKFEPIIKKSWGGMISHVYADGRLGNIQPIGFAPDKFEPGASYVYGVGGFLLAGSEIDRMIDKKK